MANVYLAGNQKRTMSFQYAYGVILQIFSALNFHNHGVRSKEFYFQHP